MEKLKKQGFWMIAGFWVFMGLMLIPSFRMEIRTAFSKLTMRNPTQTGFSRQLDTYDWSLYDLEGNEMRITHLKGRVLFINQWATWCPPCVAELPAIEKLYAEYGSKVVFLLISNEEGEKLKKFVENKGLKTPVYTTQTELPKMLFTESIPYTVLVDKEGKIAVAEHGAKDWNSEEFRKILDQYLD